MENYVSETPTEWVIVKIPDNYYKVFGVWNGGYLEGDSWKLNSGISKVEQDKDFYYFTGFSGSCYKCCKKHYGITTHYGLTILNNIIERGGGHITLMEDVDNWENVI